MKIKYTAVAYATQGKLLPGGVKEWRSTPVSSIETAEAILRGYIDGHEDSVGAHGTETKWSDRKGIHFRPLT